MFFKGISSNRIGFISATAPSLLVLLAFTGSPAQAQDSTAPLIATPRVVPVNDDPPCFCWSDGRKIAEGRFACIRTSTGRRMAECGRAQNVMSWQLSDQICPES